ncbi:MAG: amidohydrolase family protein [Candidatus Eremiobacteraeota bacterium]|nr:amidohydrolase family protein [Candidatus Eremiobacteraeota bacterium]
MWIRGGKIVAAGSAVSIPAGTQTIDATGYSVTPGFVGTHNHLYYVSGGPLFIMREMPYSFPRLYLGAGVTTIRTAGSVEPQTDLRVKDAIERGALVGPHMDVTSPYLTGYEPFFIQMGTLRSPQDARETVKFWADRGVTSFKLYTSLLRSIARAVIASAHARHLKVIAHLCSIGLTDAANMGVDSLEHGLLIDTEFTPGKTEDECPSDSVAVRKSLAAADLHGPKVHALVSAMLRHHVALSSTLAVFEGANPPPMETEQRIFDLEDAVSKADVMRVRTQVLARPQAAQDLWKTLFAKEQAFEVQFFRAGGLLTEGPDPTGYGASFPGFGDQRNMELLVQAGLTPVEAIEVATLNGAKSLGRAASIGSIATGKNADLVLIKGDPSKDIGDIERVEIVFKDGIGYDAKKLLDSVRGIAGRQ